MIGARLRWAEIRSVTRVGDAARRSSDVLVEVARAPDDDDPDREQDRDSDDCFHLILPRLRR
jgi:hypothetical protein